MEKEKRNKVLIPSIIVAVVILLIIAITLGVVYGTKPADPKWGDWTLTAPTGDGVGQVVRTNDKGEKEVVELPKLDDERYKTADIVAPTYDNEGKKKYTITIDGVDHSFEVATPTAPGVISLVVNGAKIDSTISHKKTDTISDDKVTDLLGDVNYGSYTVYTDATLLTKVENVDAYVKDKANPTLYIVKNYAVTFNSDGGSNVETRLIPHGTMYGTLATPTKEGYDFVGWYDGDKKVDKNDTVKTGNHELKAVWIQDCLIIDIDKVNNEYHVVGLKEGREPESIVIPDTYNDGTNGEHPITTIGTGAFDNATSIKHVTLGANIKTIHNGAFSNCYCLEDITIPKNVESIGKNAFYRCGHANGATPTTITFEKGSKLTTLGEGAFRQSKIQTIDIPDGVTAIPQWLFDNCTKLKSVKLPANITTIDIQAFAGCKNIKTIDIPSKVTNIGNNVFSQWTSDQTIYVNRTEEGMSLGTDWSDGATVIWGYDGQNHTYTFNVNGGDDMASITDAMAIALPTPTKEGYKFLGWYEDATCEGTTVYQAGDLYYNNKGATLYAKWELDGPILYIPILNDNGDIAAYSIKANPHNKPTGSITIENVYGLPVTNIVADGFKDCADVTDIVIPTSVTTIGANAFAGCAKIVIYTFHSTISDGWDNRYNPDNRPVFWGYDGQEYTYNFVEADGTYIKNISSTKAITLPTPTKEGYTFVGWYQSSDLTGNEFSAGTLFYNIGGDKFYAKWQVLDFLYTPIYNTPGDEASGIKGYSVEENTENPLTGAVEIPATYKDKDVIEIGDTAFANNTNITSVTLPNGILSIMDGAFRGCTALKTINIPDSVTLIRAEAFANCNFLNEIFIPTGVTEIQEGAFSGCTNVIIYTALTEAQPNWSGDWNIDNRPVIWGYDGQNHTYTFNVNGGNDIASMTDSKAIALPTPTKTGYEFLGWDEDQADNGSTLYQAGAKYYNKNDPTLYAKWKVLDFLYTPIYNTPGDEASGIKGYAIKKNPINPATGDVVIPATYNELPVTTIGAGAFNGCSSITSLNIGKNITAIDMEDGTTFAGCTALDTITINAENTSYQIINGALVDKRTSTIIRATKDTTTIDSGQSIAPGSFRDITTLTSISLPAIEVIPNDAFNGCSALSSVTFNDSNITIGDRVFKGTGFTKLDMSYDNIKDIGKEAFANCTNLGTLIFRNRLESIGANAFADCTSLTSLIKIPSSVTTIGATAFKGCTGLTIKPLLLEADKPTTWAENWFGDATVTWSTGFVYTSINEGTEYSVKADEDLYPVGDVVIPATYNNKLVTEIENRGFASCNEMTSITIPASIVKIGNRLLDSSSATQITVDKGNKIFKSDKNCIIRIEDNSLVAGCIGSTIPNYVVTIDAYAFYDCAPQSIEIPSGVQTIKSYAFAYVESTAITFAPNSELQTIERNAFLSSEYIISISEIILPSSVQTIGDSAFAGWTNKQTIYVNRAQDGMTLGTDWSANANVVWDTPAVDANIPDPTPDKLLIIDGAVVNINDATGDIVIPSTAGGKPVNMIIEDLFLNKDTIKSVLIPKSVENIGANAFSGSTNLIIYAEAESKPAGWAETWNSSDCPVIWGLEYTKNHTYMFDTMGGNKVDAIEANGLITLPDATKSGMVLDGWYENSNLTGTKYEAGMKYFNKEGATLYAKWVVENVATLDKLTFTFCPASDKAPAHYSVRSKDDVTITGHVSIPEKYNDIVNGEYPVTEIEEYGFNATEGSRLAHITSIYIPASIEIFPCVGIRHCLCANKYLKKVVFADGCKIKELEGSSFTGCTSLETVILHEGLTNITDHAFAGCENLKTVYIPSTVTKLGTVGEPAFSDYNPADTHFYIAAPVQPKGWDQNWHGGARPQNIHYGASKPAV